MSPHPSVADLFQTQPNEAVGEAFQRYRDQLVSLAQQQFATWLRERADPDGVVASVFRTFLRRAQQGEFAPENWQHVWNVLALITRRRCDNRRAELLAQQRNPAREVALIHGSDAVDLQPSPLDVAALNEVLVRVLGSFEGVHRDCVERILQGASDTTICHELGISLRGVQRVRKLLLERLERLLERPE